MDTNDYIKDLTIGQVRELAKIFNAPEAGPGPWAVGQTWLIRTVTNYWTGEIVAVHPHELVLKNAAWIADTGRYSDCFTDADILKEVEPVEGRVIIGRGAIVDAAMWQSFLPREQK